MDDNVSLTAVEGLLVGNRTLEERPTGCTVALAPQGVTAGVAVRGPAPGTRETDLLRPEKTVRQVHAVVLTGGSAFGLSVADGVMDWLAGQGHGYQIAGGPVPIVPAAVLFDLPVGEGGARPGPRDGIAACEAASAEPPAEGSVGAGAGATVGKMFGRDHAMKGGIGSAGFRFADGTVVAALVAVNCVGDVVDPETGAIVAGARTPDGEGLRDTRRSLFEAAVSRASAGENTTIGVVATNRALDQAACTYLAEVAHDGLARAVVPAHTPMDGDTLFFLAAGTAAPADSTEDRTLLGVAAADAVSRAIVRAVTLAEGLPGLPAARDLREGFK